jgi:2'-5' RNA ligase
MKYPIPSSTTDPYGLTNDEFGFSVYTLVLFAPVDIQQTVQDLRDAVEVRRSMLPAHITIKGPFCGIDSIDNVKKRIDSVLAGASEVNIRLESERISRTLPNAENIGLITVDVSEELDQLHRHLFRELDPVSTCAYWPEIRGEFRPHLTVYHEPVPEKESLASTLLDSLKISDEFRAETVSLMGHVGTPFRGQWLPISEHSLVRN